MPREPAFNKDEWDVYFRKVHKSRVASRNTGIHSSFTKSCVLSICQTNVQSQMQTRITEEGEELQSCLYMQVLLTFENTGEFLIQRKEILN